MERERWGYKMTFTSKLKKTSLMILGVLCIGMGSGMFRYSGFGADPFTTMNLGISTLLDMSFGNLQLLMNALLFVPVLIWGRDTIGIGTACNMVLVGYISDGMVQVLNGMMGASSLSFRILFLVSAMGIASFGVACYIKTELGVAPYDALQLMIEKYSRRKITYRIARIGCDLTCLVTGIFAVLLAKESLFTLVGVGTICNVLFMGPIIQFFLEWLGRLEHRHPVRQEEVNF